MRRAPALAEPEPTPAHERRVLALAVAVWPAFPRLPADVAGRLLVEVEAVLEGRPSPTTSRKDREAIEEAAKRTTEERP